MCKRGKGIREMLGLYFLQKSSQKAFEWGIIVGVLGREWLRLPITLAIGGRNC